MKNIKILLKGRIPYILKYQVYIRLKQKTPLIDDILKNLAYLLICLYNFPIKRIQNLRVNNKIITQIIFSLPIEKITPHISNFIIENWIEIVNESEIMELIFNSAAIIEYPFNINFFDVQMLRIPIIKRNFLLNQFINNDYGFWKFHLNKIEENLDSDYIKSPLNFSMKLRLYIWSLSNIEKSLRDDIERSLYKFNLKFPNIFSEIKSIFISYNDPNIISRLNSINI